MMRAMDRGRQLTRSLELTIDLADQVPVPFPEQEAKGQIVPCGTFRAGTR